MFRKILFFTFFLSLVSFHGYAETNRPADAGKIISPVYEEMLANQIQLLRRELLFSKAIRRSDSFSILSDAETQDLSNQVSSILKKKDPTVNWNAELGQTDSAGVMMIQAEQGSNSWFQTDWKGFVVVFLNHSGDSKLIEQMKAQGFELYSDGRLCELEFVQDEKGRQIVDLDRPQFTSQVFQRLVREGMNPVEAHSAAEEAVKDFRKLKEPKLLVFDRILDYRKS